MRRVLAVAVLSLACRPRDDASLAPLHVVVVAPSPEYTVMMGSFTAARDLRYRDAHCIAVPLRDGAEPVSADAAAELPLWLHEQALSISRHRYGRVAGVEI